MYPPPTDDVQHHADAHCCGNKRGHQVAPHVGADSGKEEKEHERQEREHAHRPPCLCCRDIDISLGLHPEPFVRNGAVECDHRESPCVRACAQHAKVRMVAGRCGGHSGAGEKELLGLCHLPTGGGSGDDSAGAGFPRAHGTSDS